MYSSDIRWRAVTLVYVYGVELEETARVLGVSARAISRWYAQFQLTGHVLPKKQQARQRYPTDVLVFISSYVKRHPCFFVDELRAELKLAFCGRSLAVSHSTILRALWFDLKLSRKVLERRAREAIPLEIIAYQRKMAAFYSYPEQVVFVDETSKNGKDSARKYAWSRRGTKAIVSLPFSRGMFKLRLRFSGV
jgi:transposase